MIPMPPPPLLVPGMLPAISPSMPGVLSPTRARLAPRPAMHVAPAGTTNQPESFDAAWFLPNFDEEVESIARETITDVILMNFDACLFACPRPNSDLFDKRSSAIITTQLNWNSSDAVLLACARDNHWNAHAVAVAKHTAARRDALLILTTARTASAAALIRGMCAERGIARVDHVCTAPPGALLDAPARPRVLAHLLGAYPGVERVFVFEPKDLRKSYERALGAAARPLGSSALFLCAAKPRPFHLPPSVERAVVEQLVQLHNDSGGVPVAGEIVYVETRCVFDLQEATRILRKLQEMFGTAFLHLYDWDVALLKGGAHLTPSERAVLDGATIVWEVGHYAVDHHGDVFLYARAPANGLDCRFRACRLDRTVSNVSRSELAEPLVVRSAAHEHRRLALKMKGIA